MAGDRDGGAVGPEGKPSRARVRGAESARPVTRNHEHGIKGAQAVAAAIYRAWTRGKANKVREAAAVSLKIQVYSDYV
jgi:hypothetical protein